MSVGTPNGILDITGATVKISKLDLIESTGFDTVLNNVARNTVLLVDETEQTTSNSWALKLPNAWVGQFKGYWASGGSGAPILFNFYNNTTSGTNGYTLSMDDTSVSISYDGGSTLGSATLSSSLKTDAYRDVTILFERNVLDLAVDGERVFHFEDSQLRDRVYDSNAGYVTFTHSSTDTRKIKDLRITNGDKWTREINSSNIAYVGGNVGIGTVTPSQMLDVSGNVNANYFIGVGSALSGIQSSNVSDFASNVTRISNLETADMTIGGEKTFSSNVEVGTADLFVDTTTGRVGVGTTNPQVTLAVDGKITVGAGASTTNSQYHNGMLNVIGGGTRAILRVENNNSVGDPTIILGEGGNFTEDTVPTIKKKAGTNNLAIMTSGNVGIGLTNPTQKLHVDGNILNTNKRFNSVFKTVNLAYNTVTTVHSMSSGNNGLLFAISNIGNGQHFGLMSFQWTSGKTSATTHTIYNSGYTTFTANGIYIWIAHQDSNGATLPTDIRIILF